MPMPGRLPSAADSLTHTAPPPAAPEEEEMEDAPVRQPTPRFRLDGIRPVPTTPAEPGADPTP
jgi:hypothetical protein